MADLVGHTDILTRVDPEEWQALLHVYFAEMTQRIERYGGRIEKFIGDAIFAVFGIPQAHEDDALRAVRAALEMQEALARLNPTFKKRVGTEIGLRIAAATGEVVTPGEGQLVTGELAALVERLQRQAPANGIILSERTYRLIAAAVEVEPVGSLTLKGFPHEQQAFVVRDFHSGSDRLRGVETRSPLVGREHELKILTSAYDRLLAGQGQVVMIVGEAGFGKSRLVTELRMRLATDVAFVEARCQEFTQAAAYGIAVQQLRRYLDLADNDPPEVGRGQIRAALHRLFEAPVGDLQHTLERLLRCESPQGLESSRAAWSSEETRSRVVGALLAFWEAVAARSPLLMVVEDLHWVDGASAAALRDLLSATERVPLMLLCVFRPERQSPAWDFKIAADRDYPHRYREVRLEPLSTPETEHLAALLLKRAGLQSDLTRDVARRADGNPFYVEEFVRSLQQQSGQADAAGRLPDTLHGVLQARLDGLSADARQTLQAASVIGRTFPLRLLRAAMGTTDNLTNHLTQLQRTWFLIEQQRLPEPEFAFRHVLLQEATYQTLLREERREMHRRVAEAMERQLGGGTDLNVLVHHFECAEEWERAFDYAIKAAESARSLSALQAALDHYETALRIARDQAGRITDGTLLFQAQKGRGDLLAYLGRTHEAERYFEDLLAQYRMPDIRSQIYRSLGHSHSLTGDLALAQTNLRNALRIVRTTHDAAAESGIYRDLAHVMERRRDYGRALDYATRALRIAEQQGLRTRLSDIHHTLAVIHLFGGRLADAERHAEASLSHSLQDRDQLKVLRSRSTLAYLNLLTGKVAAAREQADEAMTLAAKLGIGVGLALANENLAEIHLELGNWREAATALDSMETIVNRDALGGDWHARVRSQQGFVALAKGEWGEAVGQLEAARVLEEQTGIARHLPRIYLGLAEAHLALSSLGAAQRYATKVRTCERGGSPLVTPGALRVLGMIARLRGNLPRSVELLSESLALLKARPSCGEAARVSFELARTRDKAGQTAAARDAFKRSLSIYAEIGATPLIQAARNAARHLDVEGGA